MNEHQRLRHALLTIGWTAAILADQIAAGRSTTKGWATGKTKPPTDTLAWLEALAACHVSHPPPPRRRPGRPSKDQQTGVSAMTSATTTQS